MVERQNSNWIASHTEYNAATTTTTNTRCGPYIVNKVYRRCIYVISGAAHKLQRAPLIYYKSSLGVILWASHGFCVLLQLPAGSRAFYICTIVLNRVYVSYIQRRRLLMGRMGRMADGPFNIIIRRKSIDEQESGTDCPPFFICFFVFVFPPIRKPNESMAFLLDY